MDEIDDMREEKDFRGISFSKYKKTEVCKELLNSLINSKIEPACYWSAELICAGHYMDLWDILLTYVGKHVHLANPRLPIYIEMRYAAFRTMINNGYSGQELRLRNTPNMRRLFAELICMLCTTKKHHKYESVKIKKAEEYDVAVMSTKLRAPQVTYAAPFFMPGDPKELFIAINEFAYHLSADSRNNLLACYWLEWVMEFESICRARKEVCRCERRATVPVDDKLQFDPIWIIWEVIIAESQTPDMLPLTAKIVKSLMAMYCIRFMPGVRKKRRYLIYFAISLVTGAYNVKTPLFEDKDVVETVVANINAVYRQVKKNEVAPPTSYLFHGTNRSNLDKTFERLEMLKKMTMPTTTAPGPNDSAGGGGDSDSNRNSNTAGTGAE